MSKNKYAVGYKQPPKSTQFKPGQSGNPAGRPKGAKNLATDLREELDEKIIVTEGGQSQEFTKQRAMLKTLMARALKGESRASSVLINLAINMEQHQDLPQEIINVPEEDLAIIEHLKQRLKHEDDQQSTDEHDQPPTEENSDETDPE